MADVKAKFSELCKLRYKDQAIWFMNGFWNAGINPEEANTVWDLVKHFVELDKLAFEPKGEDGHELDQFWSAKFLEDLNSTLTASERKDALRLIDQDNNGKMSCVEYLTWRYKKTPEAVVNAPQGDNTAAIAAAQAKIDEVQAQLADCEAKISAQAAAIEAQNAAIAAQKKAIADNDEAIAQSKRRQEELAQAIRDLQAARDELEKAVEDLKAQEAAFAAKMADLEAKGKGGGVAGARALNELAQMKTEDPLPLRRAKITQEAAVRRVKKQEAATEEAKVEARKQEEALEEAKKQLEAAARRLEDAKRDLESAKAALEQAYTSLEAKMQEAVDELEEVKKNPGGGYGAIWWMERELFEADKRLPNAKQRYDHKKPFLFNPGA